MGEASERRGHFRRRRRRLLRLAWVRALLRVLHDILGMFRLFAYHRPGIAILPHPEVSRLAKYAAMRPVGEGDLDDQLRLHPMPDLAGTFVGMIVEGTLFLRELLRAFVPLGAFPRVETAAHAADVLEALA